VNQPSPERSSRRPPWRPTDPGLGSSDGNAPLRCLVTGGSGFLGRRLALVPRQATFALSAIRLTGDTRRIGRRGLVSGRTAVSHAQ
jgi:hypothetical protein